MAKPIPILLQTTIPISFLDVTRLLSNALRYPELAVRIASIPQERKLAVPLRGSKLRAASRKEVSKYWSFANDK